MNAVVLMKRLALAPSPWEATTLRRSTTSSAAGSRLVYEPAAIVLHQHNRQYSALKRQTYGYGAGLGAHLTRCLLSSPRMALVFLRHAPAVVRRGTEVIRPASRRGTAPISS